MQPQFEVNLKTESLIELLDELFGDWQSIKKQLCRKNMTFQGEIRLQNCLPMLLHML